MQNIEQQLREFVNETFLFGQGAEKLSSDDSFLELGIVDSTGVLELVNFLERQYSIELSDSDLVPENLDSLGRVTRFVERKLAGRNGMVM